MILELFNERFVIPFSNSWLTLPLHMEDLAQKHVPRLLTLIHVSVQRLMRYVNAHAEWARMRHKLEYVHLVGKDCFCYW